LPVAFRRSGNLITLERGTDELLLVDTLARRPLYVKQGGRYIKTFLQAAGDLGTPANLLAAYPREKRLLQALLEYGILVGTEGSPQPKRSEAPPGLSPSGKKMGISLYLLLSQSCNMNCLYCLDGQTTYQTAKGLRMSPAVAFRSIDRGLDELADDGCLVVTFFGGEPLLNWPLAKETILYCEQRLASAGGHKRRQYHFTTNLSFLPVDLIEWAKRYGITFLCNVDGPAAIHDRCRPFRRGRGTYQAITRNLGRLREAGLRVALRATVTSVNDACLPEVAATHKRLGGSACALVPVLPVNSDQTVLPETLLPSIPNVLRGLAEVFHGGLWNPEQLYPFNQHALRFQPGAGGAVGCGAPYGNTPVVAANGDVYPCIYLVGQRQFYAGNVLAGTYPDWEVLRRIYRASHVDEIEDCRQCNWRYLCCGGCPVARLTVTNNPLASDGVRAYCRQTRCDFTKGVLELLLWRRATEATSGNAPKPVGGPACL
jgi:uncharacterized protein